MQPPRGKTRIPLAGRGIAIVGAALALLACCGASAWAQISLVTPGSAYTQDFNTLALGGTSSSMPAGWVFNETGSSANTTYTAGTGSDTTGDTYSFGADSDPDRALGALADGNLASSFGASFTNNTGGVVGSLSLAYTGEDWRAGGSSTADSLVFEYSTDATSLTTGTWTAVPALNFRSPVTPAAGALDGNAAPNRTGISATIGALSIPDGATVWIRWTDVAIAGGNDGLAVDDFSLTPTAALTVSGTPAAATCNGAADGSITATFSGGTGPYQVKLDPGGTYASATSPATFSGLAAGVYTVSVKDASNTEMTSPGITVTQPAALSLALARTDLTCNGAGNGTVTATFSGGTGAYQVRVDAGTFATQASPFTFDSLAAGSHTVDLKDANGCTTSASISVGEPAAVTLSPGSLANGQVGAAYGATVTASGGTGPYTYAALTTLPAFLSLSSAGALSGTPTSTGSSSFDVQATDAHGCTGTITYTLTIDPAPSSTVSVGSATVCVTPAHPCQTLPVDIARTDLTGLRLFHVTFQLSPGLQLCSTPSASITEGTYLSSANPNTTFLITANGGGSYTVDGTINGTPCGATAAGGNLFHVSVAGTGTSGPGTVTITGVTLRDCSNNTLASTIGTAGSVTVDTAPVTVAAIATPQNVTELSALTITPSATLTACATGPVTWSVAPPLPAGATFDTGTGEIQWTPACGAAGTYGPFTLTATAASGDAGASNAFAIVVAPRTYTIAASAGAGGAISPGGNVSVNCGANPSFTITPDACHTIADVLVDGVSVGAVASYTFNNVAGNHTIAASFNVIVYTIAASAGAGGAIAPTGSVSVNCGSDQAFAITPDACHVVQDVLVDGVSVGAVAGYTFSNVTGSHTIAASFVHVPSVVSPPATVSASQVLLGNPVGADHTGVTVHFASVPGAASYQVYRAPFGGYPAFDGGGGLAPTAPTTWPPAAPWTLTGVTADGGVDTPPTRDFWYYVVYAQNACGDVSAASAMTGGTLDYHLGDVSDNITPGHGDDLVDIADMSLLGAHYGINLAPNDPYGYLDVGPTTTNYVDGRPLTDSRVDFEDLVMFAINYGEVSTASRTAPPVASDATPATIDQLTIESPQHVQPGDDDVVVTLGALGTGRVQAASAKLTWDPKVVDLVSWTPGEFLLAQNGALLSSAKGTLDLAVLGPGQALTGTGAAATVRFHVVGAGDPAIGIASVDARDTRNAKVAMSVARIVAQSAPTVTALEPVAPNPSRGTATLTFSIARRSPVEIRIYSVDGRLVRALFRGTKEPGVYSLAWDGRDDRGAAVAGGVFFARMTTDQAVSTRTLTRTR